MTILTTVIQFIISLYYIVYFNISCINYIYSIKHTRSN